MKLGSLKKIAPVKFVLSLLLLLSTTAFAQKYIPSDDGSKVHFVIRNFGIKTGGDLEGVKGEIFFSPSDMNENRFNVAVNAGTVDTDNETRDKNLRSEEYFDVMRFPEINITSTRIDKTNKTDSGYYYFTGTLTMHGITKAIEFPFKAEKKNEDYLFTGEFQINRLDFGIGDKSAVLSNTVNVSLSVSAKKT